MNKVKFSLGLFIAMDFICGAQLAAKTQDLSAQFTFNNAVKLLNEHLALR